MGKLTTPDWILKGKPKPKTEKASSTTSSSKIGQSKEKLNEKKKPGKTYKLRVCPKCGSDDVGVMLVGQEGKRADNWECKKCKWNGKDIAEKEISEDDFLKRAEEK